MQLNLNHIHIWSATLTLTSEEEQKKLDFLDLDEKKTRSAIAFCIE